MRGVRLAAVVILSVSALSARAQDAPKRLLVIGQSKGYQHESIPVAMVRLFELGRETGLWETDFRTDCTAITKKPLKYEAKNLDDFDAVVFFTDGDLDMDDQQKKDLLSFVREDGKGFIGVHSAAITFMSWPEYGEMLGGRFDGHPWGIFEAPLVVEAPDFPGLERLPGSFTLRDEIYQIKDFKADDVRILLRLDPAAVDLTRKGVRQGEHGFPVAWARTYGKGRVLYNGLGHTEDAWNRPELRLMWRDMVKWSMGLEPGEARPRAVVERSTR